MISNKQLSHEIVIIKDLLAISQFVHSAEIYHITQSDKKLIVDVEDFYKIAAYIASRNDSWWS